ncbi:MAG TPA: ABC transporter substrate-binding protein [Acidimicrobiia bacterium]|jgi:peptide/nickel transport system substrate-binding protein
MRRSSLVVGVVAGLLMTGTLAGVGGAPAGAASGPTHGGTLTFALGAETTGGYCLPGTAELATQGIEVATAIYDTLTTINSKGQIVPFLAKSVTPDATFTHWTIQLRSGIQFQDGEPLDANAVKLNLDTYRGDNPNISSPLSPFSLRPITSVDVTGPLSLELTTSAPWPALPWYLYGTGRTGIVAPAQLASNAVCPTRMIGTGPFELVSWQPNEDLIVKRNPHYWRPGLPYLDEIKFDIVTDAASMQNGLVAGDYDVIQTADALSIIALRQRKASGQSNEYDTDAGAEVGYGLLNLAKAPFNDINARLAVAYAGDANELNQIRNRGLETIATGPFAPNTPYFLTPAQAKAAGAPYHNLAKAKHYAALYSAAHGGQPLNFEFLTATDPELLAQAEVVKEQDSKAGIGVTIKQVDQSTLISLALAGDFDESAFLNHPQGDPDTQYVWWHSGSPVNFSHINDPVIDSDLDQARVSTSPAQRVALYRNLNERFSSQVYELWAWYNKWAVASQTNVQGLVNSPLPDGNGVAFPLYDGVIPTATIWKK